MSSTWSREQWTNPDYWKTPLVDRVLARVIVVDSGCWEFQGCISTQGYGAIGSRGKRLYTHRVVFLARKGAIPDGMQLDHLCRNRTCCNPDHLEAVTHRENTRRGMAPSHVLRREDRCSRGHDLADAYVRPDNGARQCRVCRRIRDAERRSVA